MKSKFTLDYKKIGDYYFPDLGVSKNPRPFGRWGMLHIQYLEEHHPGLYTRMLLSGQMETLIPDLNEQAEARLETIICQMAYAEKVTEELKATNQLLWVQLMNNIRNRAEEIVLHEMIYRYEVIMASKHIPIQFYVTAEEKEQIEKRMEALGIINMSAYLRKMALNGYILHLNMPEIRELIRLLRSISNSANQMTKRANGGGVVNARELGGLNEIMQSSWQMMNDILLRLSNMIG